MKVTDEILELAFDEFLKYRSSSYLGMEAALEAVFSHIGCQDSHIPPERPLKEPISEPAICDCPLEKRGVGCGHEGSPGIYCDTCAKLHPDYNHPDEIYNTDWNYQYRRFYLPNEKRENNYDYWKEQLKANKTPTLLKERDVKCNHIWTTKHVIYGDINSPCEAVCKFCGESPKLDEEENIDNGCSSCINARIIGMEDEIKAICTYCEEFIKEKKVE